MKKAITMTLIISFSVLMIGLAIMARTPQNVGPPSNPTEMQSIQNSEPTQTQVETEMHEDETDAKVPTEPAIPPAEIISPETSPTQPTVCNHERTSVITKDATCQKEGSITTECLACGLIIEQQSIPQTDHITIVVETDSSCKESGEIKTICEKCRTTIKSEKTPPKAHSTTAIIKEEYATPFENGYRLYKCDDCGEELTVTVIYTQCSEVELYAPSALIHCEVNLGECNQENTDLFDVNCDLNFIDKNNPLFFGHNTRTFGKLHKLKVGDLIYFTIGKMVSTYMVTVSEEGYLINGGTNIKGKETGALCVSSCEKETLHFFTCYPTVFDCNARWIVMAEKVEQ